MTLMRWFGRIVLALSAVAVSAAPAAAQSPLQATAPPDGLRVIFCGTSGPL